MEIVEDFDEKRYNNNGKPWKSSRILRVNPFFFIFSFFFHFFVFFSFFMFFHVLSCSFMFFHFLCLCWVLKIFFSGLNFVRISLHSSYVKNQFLGPSRGLLLFLFSYFFLAFYVVIF